MNKQHTDEIIELLIAIGVLRENSTLPVIHMHIFTLKTWVDEMGHHFWFRKALPLDDVTQTRALSKKERGRIVSFYNLLETGHKDFPITKPEMKAIIAWACGGAKSEERYKRLREIGLIKNNGMPNSKKYRNACLSLIAKHSHPSWTRKLSSIIKGFWK